MDSLQMQVPGGSGTSSSGSVTVGTATLDFGAFPGANEASVSVTGQTSITTAQRPIVFITADSTSSDHTASDHQYVTRFLGLSANVPTAGVGFTIYGRSEHKLQGTWTVSFAY